MSLLVLGLNHRTAPVAIREEMAFEPIHLPDALRELRHQTGVDEALIVSTCNRTELYCDAKNEDAVTDWLAGHRGLSGAARDSLYLLDGTAAVRHAFAVACGLDSMVIGEPQILGQVKEAYRIAADAGTAGPMLNRLFQHAFAVAKQVRTHTAIGASPISVASAGVTLARQIFAGFERHTALLVGAGDTIELTARHLHSHGIRRMIIANRSVQRARGLALDYNAFAIGLGEIGAHLAEADIIISSTASPEPIIRREMIDAALKQRRRKPMFIVDLAVPRDVEASVGESEDVYLYTVDDLKTVIERSQAARQQAAAEAEKILAEEVERFEQAGALRAAVPVIRGMRGAAESIRDETLAEARRLLAAGRDGSEVLEYLANTITSRMLHAPSVRLRQAGSEADHALTHAAAELFGVHSPRPGEVLPSQDTLPSGLPDQALPSGLPDQAIPSGLPDQAIPSGLPDKKTSDPD